MAKILVGSGGELLAAKILSSSNSEWPAPLPHTQAVDPQRPSRPCPHRWRTREVCGVWWVGQGARVCHHHRPQLRVLVPPGWFQGLGFKEYGLGIGDRAREEGRIHNQRD
jgi:hypothetical protein